MNSDLFSNLVAGQNEKHLASFLGISQQTLRNYKTGATKPPEAVCALLRLHLHGDLAALGGQDWTGYKIGKDGLFYHPFWSRGFTPWQLNAMFFQVQDAWQLKRDLEHVQEELRQAQAQVEHYKGLHLAKSRQWVLLD